MEKAAIIAAKGVRLICLTEAITVPGGEQLSNKVRICLRTLMNVSEML